MTLYRIFQLLELPHKLAYLQVNVFFAMYLMQQQKKKNPTFLLFCSLGLLLDPSILPSVIGLFEMWMRH